MSSEGQATRSISGQFRQEWAQAVNRAEEHLIEDIKEKQKISVGGSS